MIYLTLQPPIMIFVFYAKFGYSHLDDIRYSGKFLGQRTLTKSAKRKIKKIMPASDNDFDKIQEILDYLMFELPEATTEYKYVPSRSADIIFLFLKDQQIQISISNDFLEKNDRYDIEAKLVDFQLSGVIRKQKPPHIALTNSGLKIDTQ